MDLYDAIEIVEAMLSSVGPGSVVHDLDYEQYEAIRICLEAAKDKAGV